MFENERDFKQVVADLRIDTEPNPAHREQLRRKMLAAYAEAKPYSPHGGRRIASIVKLAAAAVIAVGAALGVQQLVRLASGPPSLQQVRQATLRMPWMHAVATHYRAGEVQTEEHWYSPSARQAYILAGNSSVLCWDHGDEPAELFYDPRQQTLSIDRLPQRGLYGAPAAFNLVAAFEAFAAEDGVTVQRWSDRYEDRTVIAYEIEKTNPGLRTDGRSVARLRIKLIADPQTRLLLAAYVEQRDSEAVRLARVEWVIDYPQTGPASVYDLGVPRTARTVDRTSQPIGTPEHTPTPMPTPGDAGR